ncbi:MAG: minor capsid protein [Lachnospiraceae bacterium]|nr:minor capsid protein [Lachnospiraceae bacterium]
MAKKNPDYWKDRMAALEDDQYRRSAAYYKDVQEQFRRASNSIQMDIERWYMRLAENNGVSYAGAKKLLKKGELEEFKWDVSQYIKAGEENAVDQRWMKELENASARHHISYLEAMKLQAQQHAELISAEYEGGMTDFLHKSYADRYYHTAFEMAKGTGIGSSLARLDDKRIDKVIRQSWAQDGTNFSDRIWKNKQKLVNSLHTDLTQSIIRGESPQKAIDSLAKTMNVSRAQAGRLIMTESAAIASAAQKDSLRELGVEQYEILATLDSHTSEICQELDGKVFDMKDYEVGVTAPPFHPNCRSTTVPHFDDEFMVGEERAARDEETGETYYVPANMKYGEWKKEFVSEAEDSPRKATKGNYGVDWPKIQSQEYRESFEKLSDNPKVVDAIETRAKWALSNRDGMKTEELYAVNLNTGDEIASILGQQVESGVERTSTFTRKLNEADKAKERILLIHNHPRGMPPSIGDLNALIKNENVSGITVGHDGSIYYYTRPQKEITLSDFDVALRKNSRYTEVTSMEKALEELSETYGFEFRKL